MKAIRDNHTVHPGARACRTDTGGRHGFSNDGGTAVEAEHLADNAGTCETRRPVGSWSNRRFRPSVACRHAVFAYRVASAAAAEASTLVASRFLGFNRS